ncbi:MAG: S8 family serine peptidase [Bacteroidota bacterium]
MWQIAVKTLLYLVIGIQFCFPQTYVVKFKFEAEDSTEIYSRLTSSLPKGKLSSALSSAVSIRTLPGNPKTKFPWSRYALIRFSNSADRQLIQSISANPAVEYIQPSSNYKVYSTPNDSAYSSQWNLRRIGIANLYETGFINASLPSVKVGVIDTGIDTDHPDLMNIIANNAGEMGNDSFGNDKRINGKDDDGNGFIDDWRGFDFVDLSSEDIGDWNERDNDPTDEHGHGTGVSGIIASETNNGIGLAGVVPCTIFPVRAFGKSGNGSDIDIASAIVYAADNGAEVINMSFGDVIRSPLLHDAIRYAFDKNIVLVASSGNDGSGNPHYPSDFSEVISVGSVNRFDSRSFFSSHSPALDLMAPGEEIVTTAFNGGYTNNFSGTSAAAPHVTGISALMKSIEQKKRNENPTYIPLSNEEIRGLLLNSADDAGSAGWDEFYAAGIVNASKAVQAVAGSSVVIHSPEQDEVLSDNFMNIVVTAATPYLMSASLQYGRGENPVQWNLISSIENKILLKDTIQFLDKIVLPDDVYIVRLLVRNSKGNDTEYRQRVIIQRQAPKILALRFRDSVIIGNQYGALVEVRMDRDSRGNLYFRRSGEVTYNRLQSSGLQKNHSFILTRNDFQPGVPYDIYCEFIENSSLQRSTKFYLTDSIGSSMVISPQTIPTTGFEKKSFSLPDGFLLNAVQTIDGKPTIIMNQYDNNGEFGLLKVFEFANSIFTQRDSSARIWIPRTFTKNSILVQDRGVSQLLKVDTLTGRYFSQALWGDSSDVWGSQLIDLNGDTLLEIIARSSSQFLIYKNLGNNNFSLTSTLQNPSSPLPGETRNQFGPPRSLVGDFTNSGHREILFADYDGDLIMYRQNDPASLNFVLAGIDSTNLFEMSDFITSGDFNGDGIQDVAVAGHSNLDLNNDREYDLPVWTVRVFSHRNSDPSGVLTKIWEQHFVGVKAGTSYDNGITSGKLKMNDAADALILSLNPYIYIFQWNQVRQTFESKWIHSSQSNSAIIFDFDSDEINEIGFHTNGKTEFWSLENAATVVQSPWGLTAKSLSNTKVKLQWNSAYTNHKVYRGTSADSLFFISPVVGTEWTDTTVVQNVQYFYSAAVFATTESQQSNRVQIVPHSAPIITGIVPISCFQLGAEFSFVISSENIFNAEFVLDDTITSSSAVWKSPRTLLLTFPHAIQNGNRSLQIKKLVDASGMEADTSKKFTFNVQIPETKNFFVRSVSLSSKNTILVEFNDQPNFVQALSPPNYTIKNSVKEYSVSRIDSLSPTSVGLIFPAGVNLSDIALRLEVKVSEKISSSSGIALMEGKGQILSIAQETESIGNIVVYPNPVKSNRQISFVNIPSNCRITVFSTNGEKIKIFDDVTTSEGISWDLRDDRGTQLSSGIYLYRVEKIDPSGGVTNTILGKFAVVR